MDARTEPPSPVAADDDPRSPASSSLSVSFSFDSHDSRAAHPPRFSASLHHSATVHATAELALIRTVAPSPVVAGPSSPPLDQTRPQDFVPPTRPSSTPFPQPDPRLDDLRHLRLSDHEDDSDSGEEEDADEDVQHSGEFGEMADSTVDTDDEASGSYTSYTTAVDQMDFDGVALEDDPDTNIRGEVDVWSRGEELSEVLERDSYIVDSLAASTASVSPAACPASDTGDGVTAMAISLASPASPRLPGTSRSASPYLHFSRCPGTIADMELTRQPGSPPATNRQTLFLHHLPTEIQQLILDHVFGSHMSPVTKSSPDKRLTRLACVSSVWRAIVQERLYSFIKLKATGLALLDAQHHFDAHPHLRLYVKHVELWFPVFESKARAAHVSVTSMFPLVTHDGLSTAAYVLPSDNCSLEEAFFFLRNGFPKLSVLTLEGGERKKAPQVQYYLPTVSDTPHAIPEIPTVRTLLCKGQWNIIRNEDDFRAIAAALPNLHEWRGSYSKPKSKSYLSMAAILPNLPANLTTLDLRLECDYRQEVSFPPYFLKVTNQLHFCSRLAEATPALQHLSYTGRVCRTFFDVAARLADPRTTRLKSVDLTVKNCCRHVNHWHESGSGITDLNFIRAFEALVLSAVRSLSQLTELERLRIRYVDLEFPVPPLNPFFSVQNGRASGVWSDTIVAELNRVRPSICWEELSEKFGEMTVGKDGRLIINPEFPKRRVISLKLSNYAVLAALATL